MKVKRIVASVGASFEQFIAKMENHDAVAKCVIQDIRQSAARIRSECNRVQARVERNRLECQRIENEISQWQTRAKKCIAQQKDEAKALECIRQVKLLEKNLLQQQEQREQSEKLQATLQKNLHDIEHKLEALESKRATLSSREARSSVVSKLNNGAAEGAPLEVFERWEMEVMSNEYADTGFDLGMESARGTNSSLEHEFNQQEEQEDLIKSLQDLKEEINMEIDKEQKND